MHTYHSLTFPVHPAWEFHYHWNSDHSKKLVSRARCLFKRMIDSLWNSHILPRLVCLYKLEFMGKQNIRKNYQSWVVRIGWRDWKWGKLVEEGWEVQMVYNINQFSEHNISYSNSKLTSFPRTEWHVLSWIHQLNDFWTLIVWD